LYLLAKANLPAGIYQSIAVATSDSFFGFPTPVAKLYFDVILYHASVARFLSLTWSFVVGELA